jgi:hypothetical protein
VAHLVGHDLFEGPTTVGQPQAHQPGVARMGLAGEQSGGLHAGRGLRHRRRGQVEPAGDLAGAQPVFSPQAAQDPLLAGADSVALERGLARFGHGALGCPERRLEVVAEPLVHGDDGTRPVS